MKNIASLLIAASLLALGGCSTYAVSRYSPNADNIVALRSLGGKMVNVGPFTATKPGEREIMCRAVGPIKSPDGEAFSDFVRKALVDELKLAGNFSANAPVTLTGNLDAIDYSSMNGSWNLALTVKSSNGRSMSVSEQYAFTSSWYGETACNQTAQALMPAVQNLVGKIVRSPDFVQLLN